jgi:UTP-glucose-1-phosphate uridylyltransferase
MGKPTLVILAAGMASRYGSMKQTEGFGPNGETIMDYSIFDAIRAGFGKIVFIIRKDFAADFEPIFNKKLAGKIEVEYVYQALNSYTEGHEIPVERTKPWGTAHALLCAKENIHEPFAVINADDFYGQNAFVMAANFLNTSCTITNQAIIGYELANTLSENGTVSRGVCALNDDGTLAGVTERTKVYSKNGQIMCEEAGEHFEVPNDSRASMNFFCFHESVLDICKNEFDLFLTKESHNLKAEFFLTNIGDYLIKNKIATVQVLPTSAYWFGVTYKEDAPIVAAKVNALITEQVYPASLWS